MLVPRTISCHHLGLTCGGDFSNTMAPVACDTLGFAFPLFMPPERIRGPPVLIGARPRRYWLSNERVRNKSRNDAFIIAASAVAAAAVAAAPPSRRRPGGDRPGGRRDGVYGRNDTERHRPNPSNFSDVEHFGELEVRGPVADWLRAQQKACGGKFTPSAIQEMAMTPIFLGQNAVLHSPTGTGKSLAYLLPILMRLETESMWNTDDGRLRLLILVPSGDLQIQICSLIRQLVGPSRAQSVSLIRRDADNTTVSARIVVATPRQISGLLEDSLAGNAWRKACQGLDICVVDEADRLVDKWDTMRRKRRARNEQVDPCVAVLNGIAGAKKQLVPAPPWQLVAATATLNRRTERTLRYAANLDTIVLRAPGAPLVEGSISPQGQYGDGTGSLPDGLQHTIRVVEPFYFPRVIDAIVNTIREVEALRTCVIISTDRKLKVDNATFGLNTVAAQLRFRLEHDGFLVRRCSEAVEAAAAFWEDGAGPTATTVDGGKEVVVGTREAIRGLHIDNIDAVVILGDIPSVAEYMHCAGRACRLRPGHTKAQGGFCVSIVPETAGNKMIKWGRLTGFNIHDVPIGDIHPHLVRKKDTSAAVSRSSPAEGHKLRPTGQRCISFTDEDESDAAIGAWS